LLSLPLIAEETITREHIQQVIEVTDAAARQHDTAGIGEHLSENFLKVIEFPHKKWMVKVRLDKEQYLDLVAEGWPTVEDYTYQRGDTVIYIQADGQSGHSYSTIIETLTLDGTPRVSKYREHAVYALEGGRAVITEISGHTLVGDTMPVVDE
jgi:hypothetical protein